MMPANSLKPQVGHEKSLNQGDQTQHSFRMELFGLLIPLVTKSVTGTLTLSLILAR